MKQNIQKRTVVITGASAGVGRATARAFAKEGARIGLIARGREGLEAAAGEVTDLGGTPLILQGDVADAARMDAAAAEAERELGPIDVWVNNAMTSVFAPVRDITAEEFKRVTEVTYLGVVYGTLAALKRMLPRNQGVIIQVGSALAFRGIPLQAAYCAAKHAIQGFCDSLRAELIHDNSRIRCTMIHMPALNTPQFGWVKSKLPKKAQPVPPIFQPEVAAEAIVFASHHRRRTMLVGFPTVKAVLGNRIAPALLDYFLGKTGYQSQQTGEPEDPDRPSNLFEAVAGDHGAHGMFDSRAIGSSSVLRMSKHRGLLIAACLMACSAVACTLNRDR